MTKPYSLPDDNGGRCEFCNKPDTVYERQSTVPVMLGGGMGLGTMWVCDACKVRVGRIGVLRAVLERVTARRRAT